MSQPEALIDRATVDAINGAIQDNLRRQVTWSDPVEITFSAMMIAADQPAIVTHNLGRTPTHIDVLPYQGATWWADTNDRKLWGVNTAAFHASADGRYTVWVGVR